MLPPVLYLAAPRALALSAPHLTAATAISIAPAAYRLAVELSHPRSKPKLQVYHHRNFYWWGRRSPARRYASWGREGPYGDPEQRPFGSSRDGEPNEGHDLSPREKLWRAKMEMINRMMRADPYEGLFGPSNRMLRGLNWRDSGWRKIWEEQWKSMEKMEGDMQDRARKLLQAFERDAKYPDSEMAKRAEENGKVKKDLARHGWEYDAVSNKMVQRTVDANNEQAYEPANHSTTAAVKPSRAEHVETIPTHSVGGPEASLDIPVKLFKPRAEPLTDGQNSNASAPANPDIGTETSSMHLTEVPITPVRMNSGATSVKDKLPKHDLDLMTAEDVRARMGHLQSAPKESLAEKAEKRADLESRFTDIQRRADELIPQPNSIRVTQSEQTQKLQHEQLKEAAADFYLRERRVRKEIRDLESTCRDLSGRLTGLVGRSDGFVRSGVISPQRGVQLDAIKGNLKADSQVLAKASSLLASAVSTAPPLSPSPAHMQTSLERYAWDKKPFAKIRDAEELVQNLQTSLRNADGAISAAEAALEKDVELAGVLSGEVEGQKRAMQGHEEKWRWRQDIPTAGSQALGGSELVKEIRGIYEDHYGVIDTKHEQTAPTQDLPEEALAAMHLGGIPEVSPASLDGGHYAGASNATTPLMKDTSEQSPSKPLVTYTVLALDPTMGLTKATTTTTAPMQAEEPMSLAEALQKLRQPALFLPDLQGLKQQGFEPVSSSENMMVLKHIDGRNGSQINGLAAKKTSPPPTSSSQADQSGSAATADSAVYSTRLQSPTSSTFQGLKPRRVEQVFSGEQGGHANYEKLRHHLRQQLRERRQRKGRYRCGFRRTARIIVTVAAACYLTGVVSEALRDSKDGGDVAKQERDFIADQLGRP